MNIQSAFFQEYQKFVFIMFLGHFYAGRVVFFRDAISSGESFLFLSTLSGL